jgi:uncharacterized protein with NRDE domain
MCLLVVAWGLHARYDLIVAANRDEQHARATAALDYWSDVPGMAAGRDLVAGGSWLAADKRGRFACVTNFRGEPSQPGSSHSRGRLVADFLAGDRPAPDYLGALEPAAAGFPGFNLLLADSSGLWYASNRSRRFASALGRGVHGLSNDLLDVAWPKVERSKQGLRQFLDRGSADARGLFELLAERDPGPAPAQAGLPWPATSGPFIAHERYGTRCSTLVTRDAGSTWVAERRFGPTGKPQGETQLRLRHGS